MDRDTKIKIARNMIRYGGGFANSLGEALLSADSINTEKIITTWPDLMEKYKNFN